MSFHSEGFSLPSAETVATMSGRAGMYCAVSARPVIGLSMCNACQVPSY
jgi:hypothetical protein